MLFSPLEQFTVADLGWGLPNFAVSMIVLVLMLALIHAPALHPSLVPGRWALLVEGSVTTLQSVAQGSLGAVHTSLLPLVYSLFWIVLGGNLLGNVPYSYALTTSLSADLGLSAAVWVTSLLLGAAVHRTHFVAYFAPSGTPLALLPLLGLIELISFVARAVSLGVREFANMVAGHTLLAIATSFIAPMLVSVYAPMGLLFLPLIGALIGLELAVAVMQAYVLTVLTCSYLRDALELH